MVELRILSSFVFFACFLILFLLVTLPKRKSENGYLIAFFAFLSLQQFFIVMQTNGMITFDQQVLPSVLMIALYSPTFWFYIRTVLGKSLRMNGYHYLIALAAYVMVIINLYNPFLPFTYPFAVLSLTSLLLYSFLSVRELITANNKDGLNEYNWTKSCVRMYLAIASVYIIELTFVFLGQNIWFSDYGIWLSRIYVAIHLFFAIAVIQKIITSPELFLKFKLISKRPIENDFAQVEIDLLEKEVVQGKLFKDNNLQRKVISEKTGLSVHRISEIVNGHYSVSFSDWINNMRINEAKNLLLQTDYTISEIQHSVGFNSKSVFNTSFKSATGCTPSEFRKHNSACKPSAMELEALSAIG